MTDSRKFFLLILAAIVVLFGSVYRGLFTGNEVYTHDALYSIGSFFYYVDNMLRGVFPFWDPFMLTGTYFYPNVHIIGVLDPLVLVFLPLIKFAGLSYLNAYTYWYLARFVIFIVGAYYLYRCVTGHSLSALLAAGILFLGLAPAAFRQNGLINPVFLTPWTLYFLLNFFHGEPKRRFLYLFGIFLILGITLNIYIPAYFLLNFVFFFLVIVALKIVRLSAVVQALRDRKTLGALGIGLVFVSLMAAPPIAVFTKDFSKDGELFPSLRVAIQNHGTYKRIKATEAEHHLFSKSFTPKRQFSSYGNLLNFIYPDYAKHFFLRPFSLYRNDPEDRSRYLSESFQYIGILPLFFAMIGLIYGRSRFRWLAVSMMCIIFLNMFSFLGAANVKPNAVQRLFDTLFPLLHTIDIRHNFASFFLLYLLMLVALGFKVFLNGAAFLDLLRRYRLRVMVILGVIFWAKVAIAALHYNKPFYTAGLDLGVMVGIVVFMVALNGLASGSVRSGLFYFLALLLIFLDLAAYNMTLKRFVVQRNYVKVLLAKAQATPISPENFEYFRQPFLMTWAPVVTMTEAVVKMKGAFSKSFNHTFTTKRFYEYMTHVPTESQFFLSGLARPIVGFYPADQVEWKSASEILDVFSERSVDNYRDKLFLEREEQDPKSQAERTSDATRLDYARSINVSRIRAHNVTLDYKEFAKTNREKLDWLIENLPRHLENPRRKIRLEQFTTNAVEFSVENRQPGYFYYNDGWSRYWTASDHGRPIPIHKANYNSKAVFLEAGNHRVRFVFDPAHYRIALCLYYIGLAMALACILHQAACLRRKRD